MFVLYITWERKPIVLPFFWTPQEDLIHRGVDWLALRMEIEAKAKEILARRVGRLRPEGVAVSEKNEVQAIENRDMCEGIWWKSKCEAVPSELI